MSYWKSGIFLLAFLLLSIAAAQPVNAQQCCQPDSLFVSGKNSQFFTAPGNRAETRQMRQPVRWSGIPVGMLEGRSIQVIGRPDIWYNRVEGARLGLLLGAIVDEQLYLKAGGSVNTGLSGAERWSYRASARYYLGPTQHTFLALSYHNGVHTRYESALYGTFLNGVARFFGGDDYFDYYRSGRLRGVVGHEFPQHRITVALSLLNEVSRGVSATTDFDIVGSDRTLRDNLLVEESAIRSAGLYFWWGEPPFRPRGLFGERHAALSIEFSSPELMGSDKAFVRYTADLYWQIATLPGPGIRPQTLDLRLKGATFSGTLPRHRYGIVDGALGFHTPSGSLRTLRGAPYEGDQQLAFLWEHHFRGSIFELLNFQWAREQGLGLAVFGGHGRTWVSFDPQVESPFERRVPDGFHHELGLSVTGIFSALRLDGAVRLDEPGFGLGVALSSVF